MQMQFARVKEDFGIRLNIKEEFCLFSSNRIKHFFSELDSKYEALKKKMEEHV